MVIASCMAPSFLKIGSVKRLGFGTLRTDFLPVQSRRSYESGRLRNVRCVGEFCRRGSLRSGIGWVRRFRKDSLVRRDERRVTAR